LEETIDSSITLLVAVVVVLLHLVASGCPCCVGYSMLQYVGAVVGAVVAELAGD
jgi:hypothetical protein